MPDGCKPILGPVTGCKQRKAWIRLEENICC